MYGLEGKARQRCGGLLVDFQTDYGGCAGGRGGNEVE